MHASDSFVAVNAYRVAANAPQAAANYRGLPIHALPQIHEHAGRLLAGALPKGASVLDLASGSGAMCRRLQDLGFSPTACDLVPENFRLRGQLDFHTLNLNEDFPSAFRQRFDAVTALELIEHLENPRHLIRQCFAALKPGGLLVVSTPNIASPLSLALFLRSGEFRWFTAREYDVDGHITPVSPHHLHQAMAEAGFTQIKSDFIAPPRMPGLHWWRMRALAVALRLAAGRNLPRGDIVICSAIRAQV